MGIKPQMLNSTFQAESISYAVCQYYGIQTGENSFGYIASWSQGKGLKELRASLEIINKTSCALIPDIDRHYKEICKERGMDLTVKREPEQAAPPTVDETAPAEEVPQTSVEHQEALLVLDDTAYLHIQPCESGWDYTLYDAAFMKELDAPELSRMKAVLQICDDHDLGGDSIKYAPLSMIETLQEAAYQQMQEQASQETGTAQLPDAQEQEREQEQAFLSHERDCFAIYQVSRDDPQNVRFMNLDWLQSHDISVNRSNYDLIYTAPLSESGTVPEQLEKLYQQFNLEKPVDYHSPSMSVSDIVAIKQGGKVSCHYCDSVGFTEVPGFLPNNPLKNAEMAMEDDYGMIDGIINNGPKEPTVAQLEQQARSGRPISLMDLAAAAHREDREKKKSVMEQLKSQPKMGHKKTALQKSAEREI